MNWLHLGLAFGPLGLYLLLIGIVNLMRRPLVVSGTRDTAALALAISGLVIVGPMELFFPVSASLLFGRYVWALLIALYVLAVVSLLLAMRPRLVIYNIAYQEFRPVLADVAVQLDGDARWAGDSLLLPNLGVQLHVESWAPLRNVSLISTGPRQDPAGWQRLEQFLRGALAEEEVNRNLLALPFAVLGALLIAGALLAAANPQTAADSLFALFGR